MTSGINLQNSVSQVSYLPHYYTGDYNIVPKLTHPHIVNQKNISAWEKVLPTRNLRQSIVSESLVTNQDTIKDGVFA